MSKSALPADQHSSAEEMEKVVLKGFASILSGKHKNKACVMSAI